MGDIALPSCLKPILNAGYGQTRGQSITRQQPQGVAFRQAQRYGLEPVPFPISFRVDRFGRQIFYDFYDNDLNRGANSFPMTLDSGNGLETHQCYFSTDISETTSNGLWFDISCTVLAESTPTQNKPFAGNLATLAREYDTVRDLYAIVEGIPDFIEHWTEIEP